MSSEIYLIVMVGVITLVTAISVPPLFLPKCLSCGRRNLLGRDRCTGCGAELPEPEDRPEK